MTRPTPLISLRMPQRWLSGPRVLSPVFNWWPGRARSTSSTTASSAHLSLLPPVLQPLVGKLSRALRADGSGWRGLGLVDCRATNLLAACFTGDADYTPRHNAFRDREHTELRAPEGAWASLLTAMRECSHVVLAGMSAGLRALLDTATDASRI
jgi:hypothetical protein